ncbi:efflux transporter outer membrane subunit [Polaromonas sp. SM01]|uniref:efflux transporter outer membrane subunit n=1 Tax=Polaromonas sp. SM01 TaxID=3085630 RepID=UPI00298229E7|nr:efflux transporter outer membrane subunit [Polaromonas sp. SM01]MDW5441550.1 efflux transporter outer membrane subunit [Polaromonas sp. SM01]
MRRPLSFPLRQLGWSALAATALLTGCANLASDYERPALPVPPALGNAATGTAPASSEIQRLDWSAFVQAPPLRELIALALDNNRDLRVALLAIEKARAQYGVERANLLPSVAATGLGNRTRSAADLTTSGRAQDSSQYSAQLGFSSYEIDFFGRVRNLNDVALQEYLRITENQRSVQLSLIAEVANAWLTLAADQQRLQLARDTLKSREASYTLTQRMHSLGATSGLVLAQNQTTVDSARVDVASYASQVARDRNALQALVGAPVPAPLLPPAPGPGATVAALLALPADLPSSVLLQRPDVTAAERSLLGSYASVGAARAAFFPSITLTASLGTASSDLSGLFETGNGTWSFIPQIRLPIFDAGRNRANLQVAEANQGIAVAQYEKTVQTAFREVADALVDRATLADRLAAQASLLDATQRAFTLSDARFKAGVDNYLTVLDAQRSLYLAQQALIGLQLAEQANRITLYKVLGGG